MQKGEKDIEKKEQKNAIQSAKTDEQAAAERQEKNQNNGAIHKTFAPTQSQMIQQSQPYQGGAGISMMQAIDRNTRFQASQPKTLIDQMALSSGLPMHPQHMLSSAHSVGPFISQHGPPSQAMRQGSLLSSNF